MKIQTLILMILLLNIGCSENHKNNSEFTSIECAPEKMPEFDGNKVTILDDNGNPLKDTIFGGIEKRRTVFKPCREMIYRAEFKSDKKELISNGRIKMVATGRRWEFQPEKQDEIIVQYEFTEEDFEKNQKNQLNKGFLTDSWMKEGIEGVIENVEEVWMHPFRYNQFNFTEVAPFPEVKFPLHIGKSWTGNLSIQEGWGDWENTNGYFEYKIVDKENITTNYGQIDDCWKIESKSKYEFGESKFDYWFSETLGFVKMDYRNYGNQTLVIELEEVNKR